MNIPETLILFNTYEIKSLWIFYVLAVLFWLFVIWYESLKDGFEINRVFDIAFWSLAVAGVSYYLLNRTYSGNEIFNPTSWLLKIDKYFVIYLLPYLVSFVPVLIFSRIFRWSKYRLLDIFSVASFTVPTVLVLGYLLVYGQKIYILGVVASLALYSFILRIRSYKFFSGFIFSAIFMLIGVGGFIFYRGSSYLYFYLFLFIISLVNIYFRSKSLMIINSKLPVNLFNSLKEKLLLKDKELKTAEEKAKQHDSYLKLGRTEDNAELLDEVMIEDVEKELTDLKLDFISGMRIQVKKALAAMRIGKYGICEACGKPIDNARLKIYPEATKCFECANKEK